MYVLSVFAPAFRTSKSDRYIDVPDNDLLVKKHKILERMIRRLEAATRDTEINTAVDLELEYEKYIERNIAATELAKQNEMIAKQNEALAKKNEATALALADKERFEKENAQAKITAAVFRLKAKNMSEEDIAEALDIDRERVRNILAG